jgi:hypothetical protein
MVIPDRLFKSAVAELLTLLLLISTGCSTLFPQPTPTPSATSTSTPFPTATPTLTATNTSTPTNTPTQTLTSTLTPTPTIDRTATAVVESTQTAEAFLVEVKSKLAEINIPTDTGRLGWSQEGFVDIDLREYGEYYIVPFDPGLTTTDFVLNTEITWEASNLLFCGLIFRSEANLKEGEQYRFLFLRLSGAPGWDIEFWKYDEFQHTITDVRFSDAIDIANGATNHFIFVFESNKFTIYINDVRQGTFYDYSNKRVGGKLAFFGWQETGESSCKFENTWVWHIK